MKELVFFFTYKAKLHILDWYLCCGHIFVVAIFLFCMAKCDKNMDTCILPGKNFSTFLKVFQSCGGDAWMNLF